MTQRLAPILRTFGEELAMDLLTRLSPNPAPLSLLSSDLCMDQADLFGLIRILRSQQFMIIVGALRGQRCVWVADDGWKAAEGAATGYLDRVDRLG